MYLEVVDCVLTLGFLGFWFWNKNKKGYLDKAGNYWEPVPDGHKGTHDPHWDVQHSNGTHIPRY